MEMVVENRMNGLWIIALSFFVAMTLAVISLPESLPMALGYLRPEWVALVLIYWVIALPHRVGIVVACLLVSSWMFYWTACSASMLSHS